MAKTDNLTDFLTGLADKFRAKLGGTALINPQSFESKIDEVYQKGYDSAPQGVDTSDATAAADDVQNGKTFYAGGVKKTGSLNVTAGLIDSAVTVVDEPGNNQIYAQNAGISQKAIYNKNTKTKLLIPYNKVTSAIGLTAEKVASGNTILGVAGTAQTGVDVSDTTATAADVVSSKVFYGADGTKQTGEVYVMDRLAGRITNYGGTISGGSVTDSNGTIGFYSDPYGFPLYLKGTGGFSVEAPYSVVADAINLTSDKIVSGNTILGVQGTAISLSAGIYADNANFVNDYVELGTGIQTPRLLIATAISSSGIGSENAPGYIVARFGGSWSSLEYGQFVDDPTATASNSLAFDYNTNHRYLSVHDTDFGMGFLFGKFAIIYDV